MTHNSGLSETAWQKRFMGVACYLVPLALLALFYLRIGGGSYIFWRNWFRAGCGPAVSIMRRAGADLNDLETYATAFAVLWPTWMVLLLATPLYRLPLVVHAVAGFLWCLGGYFLTMAI